MNDSSEPTTSEITIQPDQSKTETKEYPSAEEFYYELRYYADELLKLGADESRRDYGITDVEGGWKFIYKIVDGKENYICGIRHQIGEPPPKNEWEPYERPSYTAQFLETKGVSLSRNGPFSKLHHIGINSEKPNREYDTDNIFSVNANFGPGNYASRTSLKEIVDYWDTKLDRPFKWIKDDVGPYRPRPASARRPTEPPRR